METLSLMDEFQKILGIHRLIESKLTVKYKANKAESINNIRTDLAKYFQVMIIKYSYKPILL